MTRVDRGMFQRHMERLGNAFRVPCGGSLMDAYWLGTVSLDIDELGRAVDMAIAECERMPTVAELRKLAMRKSTDERAATTSEVIANKYRCRLHQRDPRQVQVDFNNWCDVCRRHGDRDKQRTEQQRAEIKAMCANSAWLGGKA